MRIVIEEIDEHIFSPKLATAGAPSPMKTEQMPERFNI